MNIPAQVTFRGMDYSPSAAKRMHDKIARLSRLSSDIVECRVVLEKESRHHRQGNLFHVRIDVSVPGKELVVNHDGGGDHAHEDPYVAIRDAFAAARRQLEDYTRKRRGDVKTHAQHEVKPDDELSAPITATRSNMTAFDALSAHSQTKTSACFTTPAR